MLRFQSFVDWVDGHITSRPGTVVLLFLALTVVFGVGLGSVSTESGTQQFAEDVPENVAFERVSAEFGPTFAPDSGSTQLIQRSSNVLAKDELLHMLRAQQRIEARPTFRVVATSSAASLLAQELDPSATTPERQIQVVERATPTEIRGAVGRLADDGRFTGSLSTDFNAKSASASATVSVVRHELPSGLGEQAGQGGTSPLTPIQLQMQEVVAAGDGDITVFGSGIIADEFGTVIGDSLVIVTPAAVIFIVLFLVLAYRDLVDLLLGTASLAMAIVWTFGFLGLAGIPFNQIMIAIPPLLLAVGIDFGIHAINRYREDRLRTDSIAEAMRMTTDQLLVAFFIVTVTTVIGFLSNLASDLPPIRDFGIVAAIGIVFVFLIFGIFLPALKVWVDRNRRRFPIPTFSQTPLGAEGSRLGAVLRVGVIVARRAPVVFLVGVFVLTAVSAGYATGVDTSFSQETFLPPEETPSYLRALPEPFRPSEYSVVAQIHFLEDRFEASQDDTVTIYLVGRMTDPTALETIYRAGENPPSTFLRDGTHARETSIVTVIQSRADSDPAFRELVRRNDRDGNGIPDRELDEVYDYLLSSSSRDQTIQYLAADQRSARIVYTVDASADQRAVTADARTVAERYRGTATPTGSIVVFQAISDLIFESAVVSLAVALSGTVAFLVIVYFLLEGRPSLGIVNTVPIVVAVALVAASMRLAGISFNAFTATVLALTIGLGIDYSVHVVHRFVDERREHSLFEALDRTVRGTGGALTGSVLTTAFGIGVLVLAVLSVLGQFGLLTALSVVYAFLTSLLVLPSVLVIWDRLSGNDPAVPIGEGPGRTIRVEGDGGRP